MTELEALKAVFERAMQVPAADPELEEALQVVDRLVKTVEQAEDDPHLALLLAEDALRQIGNTVVTYIFADNVRFYLTQKWSGPLGPDSGQAAGLTMVRAWCSSNMAGLR